VNLYDTVVREAYGDEVADAMIKITSADKGVIFIVESAGRYLIEFTTGDVKKMVREMNKVSPAPVVLVGQRGGTSSGFQTIISKYAHRRDHGRWMKLSNGEIERVLESTIEDEDPIELARSWLKIVSRKREKEAVKLILRTFPLSVAEIRELVREWRG